MLVRLVYKTRSARRLFLDKEKTKEMILRMQGVPWDLKENATVKPKGGRKKTDMVPVALGRAAPGTPGTPRGGRGESAAPGTPVRPAAELVSTSTATGIFANETICRSVDIIYAKLTKLIDNQDFTLLLVRLFSSIR